MTDQFKQYVSSSIKDELIRMGVEIKNLSITYREGIIHDDVDFFDGESYQWRDLDEVWVQLPKRHYSNREWKNLYQLEDRLYCETHDDPEIMDENGFVIAWIVKE